MKVEEYTRLKSKIDRLRQQKARAEGALEQAEERLSKQLGVPVTEAGERIAELGERVGRLRRQVEQRLEEFSERWKEKLEKIK